MPERVIMGITRHKNPIRLRPLHNVDEADLQDDGVQRLQETRTASGVRFEYYLKEPPGALFED